MWDALGITESADGRRATWSESRTGEGRAGGAAAAAPTRPEEQRRCRFANVESFKRSCAGPTKTSTGSRRAQPRRAMQQDTGEAAPANRSRNRRFGGHSWGRHRRSRRRHGHGKTGVTRRRRLRWARRSRDRVGARFRDRRGRRQGPSSVQCQRGRQRISSRREMTGSAWGLAVLKGRAGLPTWFAVGQRNRTPMEEAAVLFGAFSDRETHTRFFPVNRAELGGIEPFRRRVRRSLGFAFGLGGSVRLAREPGGSAAKGGLRSPFPPPEGLGGGLGGRGRACKRLAISPRQKATSLRESERLHPWSRMSSETETQTERSASTIS